MAANRPAIEPTHTLLCMRHGEPEASSRGRVYGKLDVGLSPRGRAQVRACMPWLQRRTISAVYSSPRARASESAAIVGEQLGIAVTVDTALAEIDFGQFEGRAYDDIERSHPEIYRQWMVAPTSVRFPGGESYDDLRSRVVEALAVLRTRHADGAILVVAHGGVIRAALADALHLDPAHLFRVDQAHAGITHVDYFDAFPLVRAVNYCVDS